MGDWRLINIQTGRPLLHHMEDHEGFVKVPLTRSVGPVYQMYLASGAPRPQSNLPVSWARGPLKLRFTSGLGCHKPTLVSLSTSRVICNVKLH
jgi:hypothetical protein